MARNFDLPAAVLIAVVLLTIAVWNGSMLLFPDSVGYFRAGEAVLNVIMPPDKAARIAGSPVTRDLAHRAADGISTARSVYYGMPFALLQRIGGWALPIVQAGMASVALVLAIPRLVGPGRATLALGVAVTLLAGLAVFSATAMPDLFTGLMILAVAMFLPHWPGAGRAEQRWWAALILIGALVHKSNLALLLVFTCLYLLVMLLQHRPAKRGWALALILLVSFGAHAAVGVAVQRFSGQPPNDPPFLLARMIDDGTAGPYLAKHCDQNQYVMCRYRARLPMTANEFLWSHDPATGLMQAVPIAEARAINNESGRLVLAIVAAYPGQQLVASLSNFVGQLGSVGVTEFAVVPGRTTAKTPGLGTVLTEYGQTAAGRKAMPFEAFSAIMTVTYAISTILLAGALWQWHRAGGNAGSPRIAAIGWIVTGIVFNAAISGVLAGVFDRYQGRVAWLMPLAAMAGVAAWREAAGRRNAVQTSSRGVL